MSWPARVDAGAQWVTTGLLEAAILRFRGFDYHARVSPLDDFLGLLTLAGTGTLTAARDQPDFTPGDVLLDPVDRPYTADMHDCAFALLRVPRLVAGRLAEEYTGLPAADLRFESIAPVSASARALWSQTVAFLCRQLIGSGITEISRLLAQSLTRLATAALLEAFPNTTMTVSYIRGPGQVTPAAVRRAAAFIDAHAGQPITVTEVAAATGVSARALQHAVRRHYDTTPTGYMRQVRLEQAHRQLQAADPATGATIAEVARRWGWAQPGQLRRRLPEAVRDAAQPHAAHLSLPAQPRVTHQARYRVVSGRVRTAGKLYPART